MISIWDKRGIRNNNPGNIRHGADWKGLHEDQLDVSFCTFISPEWGIRAMVRILNNYYYKHGLKSIASIIYRWAPPEDNNDTVGYIQHVAGSLGYPENYDISSGRFKHHLPELVGLIIEHENGINPYSYELIKLGINLEKEK